MVIRSMLKNVELEPLIVWKHWEEEEDIRFRLSVQVCLRLQLLKS